MRKRRGCFFLTAESGSISRDEPVCPSKLSSYWIDPTDGIFQADLLKRHWLLFRANKQGNVMG